ncbi:MAG: hypothetical protein IKW03_04410 [Clostridia bacterium]|nr:hypothetical protein [Clostridia bacterium]
MKHFRKLIAVILTVVLTASIALPVFASAEERVDGDHTSFDEFWGNMTDEDGSIKWQELPKTLFDVFVFVRLFEVIAGYIRDFFGIEKEPAAPETTTTLADVEIVAA